MHSLFKPLLLGAVLLGGFVSFQPQKAHAEVFVIEDQANRFSLSYPDSWKKTTNKLPEDKLTLTLPGENHFALCRVRVRSDERFVIYPDKFDKNIQHLYISDAFWDDYLSDYTDVAVEAFRDDAGLGSGHASMVEASYETVEGAIMRRKGIMFASLYHNQVYIVDCSSEESAYNSHRESFLNLVSTVDFARVTSSDIEGHYRDFTQEGDQVLIQGEREMDVYKY